MENSKFYAISRNYKEGKMQARRASRELTLITLSQLEQELEKIKIEDFENIVLESVRLLANNAQEELSLATSGIAQIKNFLDEYENNHERNLNRPLDADNIPVEIPLTSDMTGYIDTLMQAVEKADYALEIAELTTLSQEVNVKKYLKKIVKNFLENKEEIDGTIKELAVGWDISRIFKIDKNILRIAITELKYLKEIPHKVVIDEALELAKKYSTDDSPSFINGILARVVSLNV